MNQTLDPKRTIERRRFLGAVGAAAVLSAASRAQGADQTADDSQPTGSVRMIPIVDTHVHVWDLTTFRLPWLAQGSPLHRSYDWSDYQRATAGRPIEKAVYIEVDVEPAQQMQEARAVLNLCRSGRTAFRGAVISGRPASDGFVNHLDLFRGDPEIKGLRQVLHGAGTPAGYCLDPRFIAGVRLLGDRGLSFDVCVRPGELADAAKLIRECPGTSFIIDHCGNAPVFGGDLAAWRRDMALAAQQKNAVGKVSGIIASTHGRAWKVDDLAPIVNHVLDVFGPDRVVFGGDWPVCTIGAPLGSWIDALQQVVADRSEADRRKLFHDNAVRVYRLDS